MDDLISRQAAIDAVEFGITFAKVIDKSTGNVKELFQKENRSLTDAIERIKNLTSAQPERKNGEWVWVDTEDEYGWKCSECEFLVDGYRGDTSKFCPNCGCEMVRRIV